MESCIQISRFETENIPGSSPDPVTCVFKTGNTENEAKVRFTYTQGEMLGPAECDGADVRAGQGNLHHRDFKQHL